MADTDFLARLAGLKLLSVDTDGVLTDGGIYFGADGDALRRFDVKDGLGLQLLRDAGVAVVLVTKSTLPAIAERGRSLGLDHVFLEVDDKLAQVSALADEMGIALSEAGHIGDDLTDLPLLAAVGCPFAVGDAVAKVRDAAAYVTERPGGHGAVREICDLILEAKGEG